jgi:protein TonB
MFGRRLLTCAGVLLGHALVVGAFCLSRVTVTVQQPSAITVRLIAEEPKPQERPAPPIAVRLTAPNVTLTTPDMPPIEIAPEPVRVPVPESDPAVQVVSRSTGPETLPGQLELQCPERHPPRYPPTSRREREQGEVRMKVEIDELGRIESVSIVGSSGSPRLDDAAREAIQSWRCQPAERDGKPVRAVALQTMAFVLGRR